MIVNSMLKISNITKKYDKNCGIKEISLSINRGEIVAFIGPNGAGKTTLVKAIAGLTDISEGSIYLNDIETYKCLKKIGYMQEELGFYDKMTLYEVLDFLCYVKYKGLFSQEIDEYLVKYDLYSKRNTLINKLSFGMKKKLSIIMALIGEPKLIILDEPTNGIDTFAIIQLKKDLLKYSSQNSIIIVTSHVLDWVEKVSTRCVFLKNGTIVKELLIADGEKNLDIEYEKIYIEN